MGRYHFGGYVMANDFRALQHNAAMASFGLTSAVSRLRELQAKHPAIVAAEAGDIRSAMDELARILTNIRKQAA